MRIFPRSYRIVVVAVYIHEDIVRLGGANIMGPVVHEAYVFLPVGERTNFIGQVIGVCITETLELSEAGARSVKVEYGEFQKAIVSIEDAIEADSFYEVARYEMKRFEEVKVVDDDSPPRPFGRGQGVSLVLMAGFFGKDERVGDVGVAN